MADLETDKGKVHVTDYSNASRTMLFNINTLEWDDEILAELNIPKCMLPEVKPSSCVYGETDPQFFGGPVAIGGAAGDQQAALFGQHCTKPGESKNTYGTGCFLLMHTGDTPKFSENGLLTTMAATLEGQAPQYALEGSVFVGGAVIQWLRDALGLIRDSEDSEYFASKVSDTGGTYLVPAFTGLGAPHWDMYARGTLVGMTRATGRNQIVRAALESIAYQTNDILTLMNDETGISTTTLNVDGGASANNVLMQMQADISDLKVRRPFVRESTALGAAYLAGLSTGFWTENDLNKPSENDTYYEPAMTAEGREKALAGWKRALRAVKAWSEVEAE